MAKTKAKKEDKAIVTIDSVRELRMSEKQHKAYLSLTIKTQEDADKIGKIRKQLKDDEKAIKDQAKPMIDTAKQNLDNWKKVLADAIEYHQEAIEHFDTLIENFLKAERERISIETAKLQKKEDKKAEKLSAKTGEYIAPVKVEVERESAGKVILVDNWKAVFDGDITKVDPNYLLPDMKKANEYASLMKDKACLSGFHFVNEPYVKGTR